MIPPLSAIPNVGSKKDRFQKKKRSNDPPPPRDESKRTVLLEKKLGPLDLACNPSLSVTGSGAHIESCSFITGSRWTQCWLSSHAGRTEVVNDLEALRTPVPKDLSQGVKKSAMASCQGLAL